MSDAQDGEGSDDQDGEGWGLNDLTAFAEKTTVEMGETRFEIAKLPAKPAHRLWRETVNAATKTSLIDVVAKADRAEDPGVMGEIITTVIKGILGLDVDFLEHLQSQLFQHVRFTNANARSLQKVAGAEDTAFAGLEPVDIDELMVRAFAVNFTPSLLKIVSKVTALG